MLTLITGGARSGKSRHALEVAEPSTRRAFIATAQPFDDEMRCRIVDHKKERGKAYRTVEEPLDPAAALAALPAGTEVAILDCLTVWLGNLMFRSEHDGSALPTEPGSVREVRDFLECLDAGPDFHLVVVTNELGMGLVPAEPLNRAFRDLAGRLNQEVALRADRVVLMVSGLPLALKGGER